MPEVCHILVVEDDFALGDSVRDLLVDEGHQVDLARNGREALEQLRKGLRPELILLDLMMPVMDGWTFREELSRDPDLRDIPVLVMSAADYPAPPDVAGRVEKPFQVDHMLGCIQQHC
jgi:CheY-like chemotaxis protein